ALLAAAITRLVEAWDEASTGSEAPLRALASAGAADALLHPGLENGSSRLILQDTELARWTVGRVDLEASPPRVAVVVAVAAIAVVSSLERKRRQPALATDDPAFVGRHQLVRSIQRSEVHFDFVCAACEDAGAAAGTETPPGVVACFAIDRHRILREHRGSVKQ